MQKLFMSAWLILMLASCSSQNENQTPVRPDIIPQPASMQVGDASLTLGNTIDVVARTEEEKNVAGFLQEFFNGKNINASIVEESNADTKITLAVSGDTTRAESYTLAVSQDGIGISAGTAAGLFYGAQTLMQVVPVDATSDIRIPYLDIQDQPRFAYRGLHLDVSRHMFPVEFIKKYIDLLAHHKFNRFHWHLTDDQGWRIEIKQYPKLQEIAAYREETIIGHAVQDNPKYDGERYGGYYTQEEVKDVIQYAADRYVTIIPEIEMPGHALAALSAYPELGCTGGPYKAATTFGVFDDIFCAGKEETFNFLENVLDEVITLFPSKYIHIGGDEAPKTSWEKCPHCQKRMKAEKLKDEHELQSYFVQRMEQYLNSKGRQIIGWDEILEGGLAPNATVMSWRGEEGGIEAAQQGHDVIMTPGGWVYFDHYQDTTGKDPLAFGGYTPISKVYSYDPLPSQLNEDQAKHILGAQANVWTEYILDGDHVEFMVYPRACALSEVVWSPKEAKNYDDFVQRMQTHVKRLDAWDVNYAKHVLDEFSQQDSSEASQQVSMRK